MYSLEGKIQEHHSISREPEGYKKFIAIGSSPLSNDVVESAFGGYIPGNKIDIVGIDSIANLQTVSRILSRNGGGNIRIFEPKRSYCDSLIYYLNSNNTTNVDVHVFNYRYEDVVMRLPGAPSITIVDKTMLHATQPLKLLDSLTFGDPDRILVLAGYGDYPVFQHQMLRGKRIAHTNQNDIHDGSIRYAGSRVPVYMLLKENPDYLYHKNLTHKNGVVFEAVPRRVKGVVYERRPSDSIQSAVENGEFFNRKLRVRSKPNKMVDLTSSIYESLLHGTNELWTDENGSLSVDKIGEHDKKLTIGVYDLVEVVVRSRDIDKEKIRKFLPRKFYST